MKGGHTIGNFRHGIVTKLLTGSRGGLESARGVSFALPRRAAPARRVHANFRRTKSIMERLFLCAAKSTRELERKRKAGRKGGRREGEKGPEKNEEEGRGGPRDYRSKLAELK